MSARSIALITLLAPLTAAAQSGVLSLDEAIQQADSHSPNLEHARAVADEASWRPMEALSNNLPKVTLTGQHLFGVKYQVLDFTLNGQASEFPFVSPGTIFSLGANWTVFDGMETPYRYAAAKKGNEAAQAELTFAEFQLHEQIRQRYYEALAAQLLDDVAAQDVKTLQDHLDKTHDRLRQGTVTRFDLLRVQVQLDEAVPEKQAAEDNVVTARRNLAVAMGLDADNRALSGQLPIPDPRAVPAGLGFSPDARGDLKALGERADAAEAAHKASLGTWMPKIGFFAQEDVYNNVTLGITDPYKTAYSVGVGLSWTLFDAGNIARQKESIHAQRQAETAAEAAKISAPADFDNYKRKYAYSANLYHARKRAIEAAEESVRLARLGYGAGTRTNTDVLDAELDLFRARAGAVQAQLGAAEAMINLELVLGRKL